MVATALGLGKKFRVKLEGIVSSAETLNLPADTYDIVYAANTIHHVHESRVVVRTTEPRTQAGGMFFSYDPLAYNPVINLYRRMATRFVRRTRRLLQPPIFAWHEGISPGAAPGILGLNSVSLRKVLRDRPRTPQSGPLLEAYPS